MNRVVLQSPGNLLSERVDIPEPKKGEVRMQITHCGVCGSDVTIFNGYHPYVDYPLVMGHEFSGIIDSLGEEVSNLQTGTEVAVIPHLVCRDCKGCREGAYNLCENLKCMGAEADGAHTEYICVPSDMVVPVPSGMSLEKAALVEPAAVAYHAVLRASIDEGDIVLVVGAGPIGNFCMQVCRALGARGVYIADIDPWRLRLAEELGAEGTIDSSVESISDGIKRITGHSKGVNVFFDCVGLDGKVLNQIIGVAPRGSRIVVAGVLRKEYNIPSLPDFIQHELTLFGTTMYVYDDYQNVLELMSKGQIRAESMITHHFPLSEVSSVFDMIERGEERFFKIMLIKD